MAGWVAAGKIKYKTEHIVEGLENAPGRAQPAVHGRQHRQGDRRGRVRRPQIDTVRRRWLDSPPWPTARPRVHLLADRPDLPAQPRRAGRLQRRQVRRRLLADPRAGAAAQARVRRRADRDRARPARARPRLRLGSAAQLHPRARGGGGRGDPVVGAGGRRAGATGSTSDLRTPAGRPRRPSARFDAVASLGAFEHFCSPEEYRAGAPGRDLPRPVREPAPGCSPTAGASTCRRWSSGAT